MQQYYRLVCERRDQAMLRNQALQRDARQAYTTLSAAVDTSKLERLKRQYQSFPSTPQRLTPRVRNDSHGKEQYLQHLSTPSSDAIQQRKSSVRPDIFAQFTTSSGTSLSGISTDVSTASKYTSLPSSSLLCLTQSSPKLTTTLTYSSTNPYTCSSIAMPAVLSTPQPVDQSLFGTPPTQATVSEHQMSFLTSFPTTAPVTTGQSVPEQILSSQHQTSTTSPANVIVQTSIPSFPLLSPKLSNSSTQLLHSQLPSSTISPTTSLTYNRHTPLTSTDTPSTVSPTTSGSSPTTIKPTSESLKQMHSLPTSSVHSSTSCEPHYSVIPTNVPVLDSLTKEGAINGESPSQSPATGHQSQNVLVLSIEDSSRSETSLSLTPPLPLPLDTARGMNDGNSSGNSNQQSPIVIDEQTDLPLQTSSLRGGTDENGTERSSVGEQAHNNTATLHILTETLKENESLSSKVDPSTEQTQTTLEEPLEEWKEELMDKTDVARESIKLLEVGTLKMGGSTSVYDHHQKEHTLSDESDTSSFGNDDLPLPLETSFHQQTLPEQRLNERREETESGGTNGQVITDEENTVEVTPTSQETTNENESEAILTAVNDREAANAYSSFLESVRQSTVGAAVPLFDSDIEGIEEEVASQGRKSLVPHQQDQSPNSNATLPRADINENISVEGEQLHERSNDENKQLETSISESQLTPSSKPTNVLSTSNHQEDERSVTLKKRMGFWGSETSLSSNSHEIEAPEAEDDDLGDFDFYM